MKSLTLLLTISTLAWTLGNPKLRADVAVVKEIKAATPGGLYTHNRPPLVPSPVFKLPIGQITPKGWVRHMLELERNGMTGHLMKLSPWLNFKTSAWASKDGRGENGWEELPYWLRGYGDLGYVLRDPTVIAEAHKWLAAAMASQRSDGWFGPRALLTSLNGKPDLWPHMLMLDALQSYYEYSGDPRAMACITGYLKWENRLPASDFGNGYWPKIRAGDNLQSVFWLYNRTGDRWLLDLARKIHDHMARWDQGVINWHNVNIAQGFRAPAEYYQESKNLAELADAERNYDEVMGIYGQFPGGGFAGDENCRPGYTGPRQGFETCGIVEFMHSFEMLTKISGNPIWADRCENIAFNTFPASMTPDEKALHYLTCPNQIQLDPGNKSPEIQNRGEMFSYSPYKVYRCCQHNVAQGWPYFAEELWLGTHDDGLCASLYAASEVTAKVGDGTEVRIDEQTRYPFGDVVHFKLATPQTVNFPLYLRIPQWCEGASLRINGQPVSFHAEPLSYLVVTRDWADGDTVTLTLPMRVTTHVWHKNHDSVSVNYGPLTFSLDIRERWQRFGDHNTNWPEWEVYPASPWNYGLVLNPQDPASSFQVVHKPGPVPAQPWTPAAAPIELLAKGRRIPHWVQDKFGLVGKLQQSPVRSDQPVEAIKLIPMGAARLRLSAFPVVGNGPDAHQWTLAPVSPVSASYCNASDTVNAVNDGLVPKSSDDHSIPRFTWWDHRGTQEWIEWKFPEPRKVSGTEVYWFDDTGHGSCRVPQSWQLLYRKGDTWKPVADASGFGVAPNQFNRVSFSPVTCAGLKIAVQLRPHFSGGILEWKVID